MPKSTSKLILKNLGKESLNML